LKKNIKFLRLLSVILFFVGWHYAGLWNIIPYLGSPLTVVEVLFQEWRTILLQASITLARGSVGFLVGTPAGIAVALMMAWSGSMSAILSPYIRVAKSVPVLALIPIFILWFGIGEASRVLFVAVGCFFILVVVAAEAIENVPKVYRWAGGSLGATRGTIFARIILPSIMPGILGGLRIAAMSAFPLTLAAEFVGAQSGLGYYLIKSEQHLTVSRMILGALGISLLGVLADWSVSRLGSRLLVWSERGI
jgi:ABC-type nitrate/sulfonate/bicarbonate transport system permease component